MLIAIEGPDGSGKSTQAKRLAESLGAVLTFQFGATDIGGAIRAIVLDPANIALDDRAEALLIVADKAQHVDEVVGPALAAGQLVVTDRFTASTLAYQGYGRGLDLGVLRSMMDFATDGLEPNLTVLLDIDLATARARLGEDLDRIEKAGDGFHERVRAGYLEMAEADPRWVVVDGASDADTVAERVRRAVSGALGLS